MRRVASVFLMSGLVVAIFACGGGGSPSAPAPAPTPTPAPKASIIVIMLDDMDSGSTGDMPKLLSLIANRGVNFPYSYATLPLCAPARASLLTGQYAHNHGVHSNDDYAEVRATGLEGSNVATWLKGAGYANGLFGKYFNNYPSGSAETFIPQGWDEWFAVLEDRDVDNYDWQVNDNGRIAEYHGTAPDAYQTDVLADKAVSFIRRTTDKPLFMVIGPSSPHLPAAPAPRHEDLFQGIEAPRTPSFNEADVSDKPFFVRSKPLINDQLIRQLDLDYRKRLQALQSVDDMIQKLVDALQAAGRLDNTYIFFTGDNGFFQGQHRFRSGKNAAYEESISVPLIVRGPRVSAGAIRNHLVGNIDLAPTFCEIAGIPIPTSVDGRSLLGPMSDSPTPASSWRQDLLIDHYGGGQNVPPYGALRVERPDGQSLAYIEFTTNPENEFYDLRDDPDQLTNRYQGGDAGVIQPLAQRLHALQACAGAACRP